MVPRMFALPHRVGARSACETAPGPDDDPMLDWRRRQGRGAIRRGIAGQIVAGAGHRGADQGLARGREVGVTFDDAVVRAALARPRRVRLLAQFWQRR